MLDVAIIGSGPAGLSAAINAKTRNKEVVVFGKLDGSSKVKRAEKIDNYLGFLNISGEDLMNNFLFHAKDRGIDIRDEKIQRVYSMGDFFALELKSGDMIQAKSVIIASGVEVKKPLKKEMDFLGAGVSYCATCDAALYRDKKVVVIGMNEESIEEANFISEIAKTTIFINLYKEDIELNENITVIKDIPLGFEGRDKVSKLVCKNSEIFADGFFIIKDSKSADQLVPGLQVEENHIRVDSSMQTNIEGLFACGDVVGLPYQIGKAVGEGNIAGLKAASYANKK